MKKFLSFTATLFLCLGLLCSLPALTANADTGNYACAVNSDTYFYSTQDENNGLFILPQSYYVKILSKGETFSYVQYLDNVSSYKALYGYCKTQDLLFVDFVPVRPYLYYTFTVKYYIDGYLPTFSDDCFLSSLSYECVYYGDYKIGSSPYFYVLLNGSFGYIPKTEEIAYERNTDYVKSTQAETPPEEQEPQPSEEPTTSSDTGFIVMCVVGIALVVIAVLVLVIRPEKKRKYNEEE